MNHDTLKGSWTKLQGKVKERWGKLTDDDLAAIQGKREQLEGAVQKRYGIAKEKAKEEVSAFARECGC